MADLTKQQHQAIIETRKAIYAGFHQRFGRDGLILYATTCTGAVVELLMQPDLGPVLLDLLNSQLAAAGTPYEIARRPTN